MNHIKKPLTYTVIQRCLTTASKNSDYNFWQCSKIPTMHFQKSLPRLPIPKLEQTCERYLAAQKPLLINEAYQKTEANVNRFKDTTGKQLQELLIANDKKNKHTSYISELWFDMYLRDRTPIPINYNPFLVFRNNPKNEYNTPLIKTTNLLLSSLRFHNSLKMDVLEPEVFHMNPKKTDNDRFRSVCSKVPSGISWYTAYMLFKAFPLDMSQFYNLFNSTRIPEIDKDRIYRDPSAKHVLVQSKGHFYIFDVFDEAGNILPKSNIMSKIDYILKDKTPVNEYPIGILTTADRNHWATLRHELQNIGNENVLKKIDNAFISICLDDKDVGDDLYGLCRNYLHGDGQNRWFDKSVSLIISKDGVGGVNFEHSWGDGVAVLRYFQDIHKDFLKNPQVDSDTQFSNSNVGNEVTKLDFKLNEKLKENIKQACRDYDTITGSLDLNFVEFDGLGKDFCKKHSVSPDAVMQLGFQTAYHKLYGKFVPTYESCSTSAFKHGRTEAIRPCTIATKAFCETINSSNRPSEKALKEMILNCSTAHGQLTKEAAMGQGFDRHLFALKKLGQDTDHEHLNIFDDPAYVSINKNILSTSTLSSPVVWAGGFGPVVDNGLGIGYMIRDESLGVLATSYNGKCDGKGFIDSVTVAFKDFLKILSSK